MAASAVWLGGSSSDWFIPGNWNTAAFPGASDTATIDQISPNPTVVNGGAANAQSILIGASGTGSLTITNGGTLTDGAAALGVLASGTGQVTVSGYGSSWTSAGNISVGTVGSGSLQILAGGNVSAVNASLGDQVAGASGNVTVSGSGSSFSTSNLLFVGDHGSGILTVSAGGKVMSSAGAAVGNSATANGTATIDGAGSAWILSNYLAVGAAGRGTVTISNGGTITSIAGVIGNFSSGSMTVRDAGSAWVNSGAIGVGYGAGANGTLVISNGGTVTSTAGIVYLGQQSGSTGALFIGSTFASALTAPGTLNAWLVQFGSGIGSAIIFNHTSNNYVFASQIAGAGAVNQAAGYTVLSANSTYTGTTQISGGTLAVTGSIANSSGVLVQTGGTLAGTGTVGGTVAGTFVADGILSPGINGAGTLSVQGSLILQTAASYLVQINGSNSTSTSVMGTAQIDGTVSVVPIGRVNSKTTYTILSASAGVSGTFANLAFSNTGLARNPQLTYTPNSVLLTLDPGLLSPLLSPGANINQRNVAAGIDNALSAGAVPSNSFNTLLGLTGATLNSALTQASGETATGTQQSTFDAMSQFINAMVDPFIGSRANTVAPGDGGAMSYAEGGDTRAKGSPDVFASMSTKASMAAVPRLNVWAVGYGGSRTTDGNAVVGSNTATSRIAGTAVGVDYLMSPNTIAGFALGGGGTSFSIANGLGGGRSDLFQAGIYARHSLGNAYLAGAAAYGWQDITTDRTVTIAGLDQLQARFNTNTLSGRVEGGYRFATRWMGLTPYAAAQFTSFFLPGYDERALSGADTFALNYAGRDVTGSRGELGFRADRSYALQTAILTLRGRFAWAHDYNPDRTISATFQTLPGASFVVNGAAQAHDSALTTASAEMKWANGWSAAASFEGEFSNVTRSYAGKGVMRYAW